VESVIRATVQQAHIEQEPHEDENYQKVPDPDSYQESTLIRVGPSSPCFDFTSGNGKKMLV